MKITQIRYYGGALDKVCRLGLARVFLELQNLLLDTEVRLLPEKHANDAGKIRGLIDAQFKSTDGWIGSKSGDIAWVKNFQYQEAVLCRLGVEILITEGPDQIAHSIERIRNNLQSSHIDAGVIVVPSDGFECYMSHRVANFSYAARHADEQLNEAQAYQVVLMAIEHDGFRDESLPES